MSGLPRSLRRATNIKVMTLLRLASAPLCALVLLAQPQISNGPNLMLEPPGLTAATAAELEHTLVSEPENLDVRMRLVRYYFLQAMPPQRAKHIFWMIEHHPESNLHATGRLMLQPRLNPLNTPALYEQGKLLWLNALKRQPENRPILINAARYTFAGDPFEAEKLLLRARRIPAANDEATRMLVSFYSYSINAELSVGVGAVYDPNVPGPEYREHVRGLLAHTNEAIFPGRVGLSMAQPVTFPVDSPPPPEVIELYKRKAAHGVALLKRAQALEPNNPEWRLPAPQ